MALLPEILSYKELWLRQKVNKQNVSLLLSRTFICVALFSFLTVSVAPCFSQGIDQLSGDPGVSKVRVSTASLGLKKLRLKRDESTNLSTLRIEVEPLARCIMGDLDAMMLDARRARGKNRVQLSLEPIGGAADASEGAFADSPVEGDRAKGLLGNFVLTLPHFERPTLMGLFLCSASTEDYSSANKLCSNKGLMGFSEMVEPYKIDSSKVVGPDGKAQPAALEKRGRKFPKPKIYFFSFLILHGDSVIAPSKFLEAKSFKELGDYLKSLNADVDDFAALETTLKKYGDTLGSMPLKVKSNRLNIVLPYYSRKKCSR